MENRNDMENDMENRNVQYGLRFNALGTRASNFFHWLKHPSGHSHFWTFNATLEKKKTNDKRVNYVLLG